MNVYRISYTTSSRDELQSKTVIAKDTTKAVADFLRYAKKNVWNLKEIVLVDRTQKVDIYYKS